MLFQVDWLASENVDVEMVEFRGEAALSLPFRYELMLHANNRLENAALLNSLFRFDITINKVTQYFSGYVQSIVFIQEYSDHCFEYQMVLAPWFLLLNDERKKRNFKNMMVIDICKKVLPQCYISYFNEAKLMDQTVNRSYTVQYDETDFQFISRLLREEGIHYYFLQKQHHHYLILFDGDGALPFFYGPILLAKYAAPSERSIFDWQCLNQLQSSVEALQCYDGKSHYHEFYPGLKFQIDSEYKIIRRIIHYAVLKNNVQQYHNAFKCIQSTNVIQTGSIDKPVISGVQVASVIEGCTRVHYAWGDSIELLVSQYWAGCEWGALMLPQPRDQAVLAYIDGDAARPIILGCAVSEMPRQQGFITQQGDALLFSSGCSENFAWEVAGDFEKRVQHDMVEIVGQDDVTTIAEGNQVMDVLQGKFRASAAMCIRFQVGDSFIELSPDEVTLHAAEIGLN